MNRWHDGFEWWSSILIPIGPLCSFYLYWPVRKRTHRINSPSVIVLSFQLNNFTALFMCWYEETYLGSMRSALKTGEQLYWLALLDRLSNNNDQRYDRCEIISKSNTKWLLVQNAISLTCFPDSQNTELLSKQTTFDYTGRIYKSLIQWSKVKS